MSKKVKVVLLHNILSPHVAPVFCELAKKVDLTVLYCAESELNRTWKEKPRGFRYKILKNFSVRIHGRDLFTYFINPTILSDLNKLKPDVIIISGWDIFSYQIAFFYAWFKGIKLILWSGSTKFENSWRRTVSKPLVSLIIKHTDSFIAYGTRAMEYLISLGANRKKNCHFL